MKQRIIKNDDDRDKAISAIMGLEFPYVLSAGKHGVRTKIRNAHYWASMDESLGRIRLGIKALSDETGNTPQELRVMLAERLLPLDSALMYCITKESAHEILKGEFGVDTTTRLGTKDFIEYEEAILAKMEETASIVQFAIGRLRACKESM